jgi:hypothetical protein
MVFIPNSNFLEELRAQPEHDEALAAAAEAAKPEAETRATRIMPRNPDAFEVQVDDAGVRLVNTDYGGHLEEWGSINNPPQAPLRIGVRAVGLRLEEHPKS